MGKKDVSATPEKDDSGGNKPRQASVQRLAGPKRVQDRVKEWQKMNARAMAGADPERAPTEPSDVVKKADDEESVTEEDRVRIKFRQQRAWERQRRKSMGAVAAAAAQVVDVEPPSAKKERVAAEKQVDAEEGVDDDPRRRSPPKKRIVSDDNWLKAGPGGRRKASPDEGAGKMAANKESTAAPIPKDFLERTARNPSPSDKVRQWAEMVEPPSPKEASKLKGSSVVDTDAEYDGIRVKPIGGDEASERTDTDVAVRDVSPQKRTPAKPKVLADDDGIRVTPIRKSKAKEKEKPVDDDGIRVRPIEKSPAVQEDDGIRVRTIPRQPSIEDDASTVRETTLERQRKIPSPKRRQSVDRDTVADDPLDTPTKKRPSRGGERMMVQADDDAATVTEITQQTGLSTEREEASEKESPSSRTRYSDEDERNSYMMAPSTAPQKSLAEIPFGYSAFSELDLPLGADAGILKRPKATSHQHPSFKAAVPKVFKKVVSGTQKIIHDKVDPPKPVVNQPPSIESWLNKTIDPFVSAGAGQDDAQGPAAVPHKRRSVEKEWEEENRERRKSVDMHERAKRRLSESRSNAAPVPQREAREEARGEADSEPEVEQPKPAKKADKPNKKPFTPPLSGLKRSKATRVAEAAKAAAAARKSSGGGGIRFFSREAWRDVFSGESALKYPKPPKDFDDDYSDDYTYTDTLDSDSRREGDLRRRYSSESGDSRSPRSPPRNEELRRQFEELTPKRKPPTNGAHELSTIVSVETASTHESEVSSVVSQTTITQETALPRDKYGYPDLSPRGSRKDTRSPSGLRRRFTKHSDLMSMLSLPDEAHENTVMRSTMYRTRSRRHCGPGTTIEDLLMDFAEDENFYRRELKALIEGVVPVLLNQMVHGDRATSSELFGGADATPKKVDSMIKAMVDMAMALEKLKSQHIRAPLADYPGLLSWLDTVVPTYQNYLDVWRLGFHGIVVNLAPAPGRPDDEDSLVNALPRNEDGDVINDQGERIDVAYLLKRPQARIKRILKFIRVSDCKSARELHLAIDANLHRRRAKPKRQAPFRSIWWPNTRPLRNAFAHVKERKGSV